jgi:20S proteasome alpha/beta subunit
MTFILGAKCADGVVLVADRKITIIDNTGMHFRFRNKLFAELRHVVFGSSGSTGNYELFRGRVRNHIRSNTVAIDDVTLVLSDQTFNLNDRYRYRSDTVFDVLVGIVYRDRESILTYINAYGLTDRVETYQTIGIGAKYSKLFLEKAWNAESTMEQVAEIGYFIIRYIEKLGLDLSVGLDNDNPQVWYIPNRYEENEQHQVVRNDDRQASNEELDRISIRVEKRLKKHENHLAKLFR